MLNLFNFFLIIIFFQSIHCGQSLRFQKTDEEVTLFDNSSPIFSYQAKTRSENGEFPRANYLHPLYDLNGNILTEDFPADHPHHRGIFWSWHQLKVGNRIIGDPWLCEGITWNVENIETKTAEKSAELTSEVYWKDNLNLVPLIKEDLKILYRRLSKKSYMLDFEIKVNALSDSILIGGSDDIKGYGGFSARIFTKDSLLFFNSKGRVVPRDTAIKAGDWIGISFNEENDRGVIMTFDSENDKYFIGWILRSKGSMQNAASPGRDPIPIYQSEPFVLRNRIYVYNSIDDLYSIINSVSSYKR